MMINGNFLCECVDVILVICINPKDLEFSANEQPFVINFNLCKLHICDPPNGNPHLVVFQEIPF